MCLKISIPVLADTVDRVGEIRQVIVTLKSDVVDKNTRLLRGELRALIARVVENALLLEILRSIEFNGPVDHHTGYTQLATELNIFSSSQILPEIVVDKIQIIREQVLKLVKYDVKGEPVVEVLDYFVIPTVAEIWLELCERVQHQLIEIQRSIKNS